MTLTLQRFSDLTKGSDKTSTRDAKTSSCWAIAFWDVNEITSCFRGADLNFGGKCRRRYSIGVMTIVVGPRCNKLVHRGVYVSTRSPIGNGPAFHVGLRLQIHVAT